MALATYAEAMRNEMKYEGGKVDHPNDPGGRTNMGVIQRNYSAYRRRKGLPDQDVYKMTIAERDEIYRTQYANAIKYDLLPEGVDLVLLDGAINSGVSQSVKWLQRALGLTADGVMGDVTVEAARNYYDHDVLVGKILERRLMFLKALRTWGTFGKGWSARLKHVQSVAQSWASGSVGKDIEWTHVAGAEQKANLTQAVTGPSRALGDAVGTGGTVTTTLTTVQGTLEPLQGTPFVDKILMWLLIVGVLCTAAGFAYSWYSRKRRDELTDALDLAPQAAPNNNDVVSTEFLDKSAAPNEYQGVEPISKGV